MFLQYRRAISSCNPARRHSCRTLPTLGEMRPLRGHVQTRDIPLVVYAAAGLPVDVPKDHDRVIAKSAGIDAILSSVRALLAQR